MYPLNNQLVLNYFQLVFIKTKLESHLRHNTSDTKIFPYNSDSVPAPLIDFQMSNWPVDRRGFKIKINTISKPEKYKVT